MINSSQRLSTCQIQILTSLGGRDGRHVLPKGRPLLQIGTSYLFVITWLVRSPAIAVLGILRILRRHVCRFF